MATLEITFAGSERSGNGVDCYRVAFEFKSEFEAFSFMADLVNAIIDINQMRSVRIAGRDLDLTKYAGWD